MPARIYGVRHALVENPDHVVYARLPKFGLSEQGRLDAERAATSLASADIAAVFASPLVRAQETAGILAAPHGLEIHTEPRLIEWSFWTQWEGMPWASLRELEPEVFSIYARDPGELSPQDPLHGVGQDVVGWSEEVAARFDDGIILAVSHESPLKAAYLSSRGEPTSNYPRLEVRHLAAVRLQPGPAEITDLVAKSSDL